MPRLTVSLPISPGPPAQGERGGLDQACKWMEEVKEEGDGRIHPVDMKNTETVRTPGRWRSWRSLPLVGAVWALCRAEALHPSEPLLVVCWRLLPVCVLWLALGGCVHALKGCLQPGQEDQEGPPLRKREEVMTESGYNQCSCVSQRRGRGAALALALAHSLLLCVLHEPLAEPSVPHIHTLLSRLESVSHTLEKADTGSEVSLEEVDRDSVLVDKVKLIRTYLQQRLRSLRGLVQVQGDFEAGVKELLEGLDGLWGQLEELHTRVTLTKEGSSGLRDLASARKDTETLFTVLGHYESKLQCCQAPLRDSMQLLQELTWSHAHISGSVSSSSESVWPELLLQANIEQFDKVQEGFLSLEQQTSTFQAHLEGLGEGTEDRHAGPLAPGARLRSVCPQTSLRLLSGSTGDVSVEQWSSSSMSVSSVDADDVDTSSDARLSLCERSALHVSSTIGRLRKSAWRK